MRLPSHEKLVQVTKSISRSDVEQCLHRILKLYAATSHLQSTCVGGVRYLGTEYQYNNVSTVDIVWREWPFCHEISFVWDRHSFCTDKKLFCQISTFFWSRFSLHWAFSWRHVYYILRPHNYVSDVKSILRNSNRTSEWNSTVSYLCFTQNNFLWPMQIV